MVKDPLPNMAWLLVACPITLFAVIHVAMMSFRDQLTVTLTTGSRFANTTAESWWWNANALDIIGKSLPAHRNSFLYTVSLSPLENKTNNNDDFCWYDHSLLFFVFVCFFGGWNSYDIMMQYIAVLFSVSSEWWDLLLGK